MAVKTYTVMRAHQGDKWYAEGDEREADENYVAHLVERGVLQEKAAPKPKNKAVQSAPKNKAG